VTPRGRVVRQVAALQKGIELVLDELRQVGAGFDLSEEGRRVLLPRRYSVVCSGR